jgi:hypothetical protein
VTTLPARNNHQCVYLLAIFKVDQEVESENAPDRFRPFQPRPKASEWRWLEYSEPVHEIIKPASRLYEAIENAAPIDQGTGSTFRALADRGLIEVEEREFNVHGQPKPYVRLTPAGRRLARSWTGQQAYKAPPPGTLREWHWRALAQAYVAGDEGIEGEYGDYGRIGWTTWRRLIDYKWGALVTEGGLKPPFDHRLRIPAAGRDLYEREWSRYRQLYPEVDAVAPRAHAR